jgi:phenylpropionate dioxygenase-like ring-hydroxylating dioxygenase large terminal subunit
VNLENIRFYVDDRPDAGIFRVHRDVFSDPQLFELELKHIFERTWNFLTIESQLPRPHDFVTAWIGRTPVLVTRTADERLAGLVNVCRHKGMTLCRSAQGNAKHHVCAYHGWIYDSSGRNLEVKDRKTAGYAPAFDAESHDLLPLARLDSYKGLIFGSLSPEVPPLADFLGELRFFLDLAMEQGPRGMEFVPGRAVYTYSGNWKLQMDNGLDSYHLTSTHKSFMDVQARRRDGAGNQEARGFDWQKRFAQDAGMFNFAHGHSVIWAKQPEVEKRPIYPSIDEIRARVGAQGAEWMLHLRNLLVFPCMQIADATSLLVRTFRPLAVDRTEMRVHCLAPIGEAPEQRAWRLRQFEDFFNPGGLATPDDAMVYEDAQRGYSAQPLDYLQGWARGIALTEPGANDTARAIGVRPTESLQGKYDIEAETCFHAPYREWLRLMEAGLAGRRAYA